MFRVRRPIASAVEMFWVTETKETSLAARRRRKAGRSVLAPVKPPSSKRSSAIVQPGCRSMYPRQASRWESRELKLCSSPWEVDFRVYIAHRFRFGANAGGDEGFDLTARPSPVASGSRQPVRGRRCGNPGRP